MNNNNFNIIQDVEERGSKLGKSEEMYGRCLKVPNIPGVSGSRRLMYSQQEEQRIVLNNPEVPLLQTGYDSIFGKYSSSINKANCDYEIIAKISKFNIAPEHHYFLIIRNENNEYDVIERICYNHITENYGYMYNNAYLDSLEVGSIINSGDTYKKSTDFDHLDNRQEGVNLITTYIACETTKEDGIIISESAAKKMSSPLLQNVRVGINTNDIPLNLYGDEINMYKVMPDIGEECNGTLIALRREKKEQILFAQSYHNLRKAMIGDEKFIGEGTIIDINIFCNNQEIINDSVYYKQLDHYNRENRRFYTEIMNVCSSIQNTPGVTFSYELSKLFKTSKQVFSGVDYIRDKRFSNIELEVVILRNCELRVGDKITNRYGGKGVISEIRPDELMPQTSDGPVELIFNSSTCINRENSPQLFEISINYIGDKIRKLCNTKCFHRDEVVEMLLSYMRHIVPNQASFLMDAMHLLDENEQDILIESFLNDEQGIYISMEPSSENITIDKLAAIYEDLPFITQEKIHVPLKDSMGNIRYVETRRPMVCGKQYIIRMKQYAEDKTSATSLSSTDLKGMNAKSKNKKTHRSRHSKTCIRFGEMEVGNLLHMDPSTVVSTLMLHSLSPAGRRLCEGLLTDDPFDINIQLDDNSSNRAVEILNAYLKTMGLRFVFNKFRKTPQNIFVQNHNYGGEYIFKPNEETSIPNVFKHYGHLQDVFVERKK